MTKNNKIRYAKVMILCAVLNIVLYCAAHFFHLPLWMDMQGTVIAAFVLEPVAGILVGFVQSFFESVFFYDVSTIIYFAVSASAAIIAGVLLKKDGKITVKRVMQTIVLTVLVTSFISTIITFWVTGGVPGSKWECHFYDMAMARGIPQPISTFFGIMVLKLGDAVEISAAATLVYMLMPKSWKHSQ